MACQAHIPKRATQHGIHLAGSEITPPELKPGQTDLRRQDLYTSEAKPVQAPYLFQDQFQDSSYSRSLARITLPEDYVDPVAAFKPPDVRPDVSDAGGTAHWTSEYKAALNQAAPEDTQFGRPYFPMENFEENPTSLGRGSVSSSYQEEFGKYRSNPRDKIGIGSAQGFSVKKSMDAGTTKGTRHIPGYQGFIPGNTFSEEVARIEKGDFSRSVDKTNIEQTYHCNLIGYSGHQPSAAINHRGGRQPSTRTVYGHDYPSPPEL